MSADGAGRGKGFFGAADLPIASRYPASPQARWRLLFGALLAFALAGYAAWDTFRGPRRLLSSGPLSSAHAQLEGDCGACHGGGGSPSAVHCSVCHEKFGDRLGIFTFAAHYLYRSDDFGRVAVRMHEAECSACHAEHRGRDARLTDPPEATCRQCHDIAAFDRDHPEIVEVGANGGVVSEVGSLHFSHALHVPRVVENLDLIDVERACLTCHRPLRDGRSFAGLDFSSHCSACHLGATIGTPWLERDRDGVIGVASVEMLRGQGPPGSIWHRTALGATPRRRELVRKVPLEHPDAWVLENLRRLRRLVFPDAGLADLLATTPALDQREDIDLYREAVAELRRRIADLVGSADRTAQLELRRLQQEIEVIERALEDPYQALDAAAFERGLEHPARALDAEQRSVIEELAMELTTPCRQCHVVEELTIAAVPADQRTLRRAEFDHRAHIIQRRCLDCHATLQVDVGGGGASSLSAERVREIAAADPASTLHLPGIATCRECHRRGQVSQSCGTCHQFHPAKDRRSDLLLYVSRGAAP